MTAVSLGGGGDGYALLAHCYGCRALSWRKQEVAGTWTQTGSLRHSPCFRTARAGRESRGRPGGASGSHCCCCCISNPGGNESVTVTPPDRLGDLMAGGRMRRLEDRDPGAHRRLQWSSCANIQPLCPSPTVAQPPCLAPTALCLAVAPDPSPSAALTLGATLHLWFS